MTASRTTVETRKQSSDSDRRPHLSHSAHLVYLPAGSQSSLANTGVSVRGPDLLGTDAIGSECSRDTAGSQQASLRRNFIASRAVPSATQTDSDVTQSRDAEREHNEVHQFQAPLRRKLGEGSLAEEVEDIEHAPWTYVNSGTSEVVSDDSLRFSYEDVRNSFEAGRSAGQKEGFDLVLDQITSAFETFRKTRQEGHALNNTGGRTGLLSPPLGPSTFSEEQTRLSQPPSLSSQYLHAVRGQTVNLLASASLSGAWTLGKRAVRAWLGNWEVMAFVHVPRSVVHILASHLVSMYCSLRCIVARTPWPVANVALNSWSTCHGTSFLIGTPSPRPSFQSRGKSQ
jgi:hypothetical protein